MKLKCTKCGSKLITLKFTAWDEGFNPNNLTSSDFKEIEDYLYDGKTLEWKCDTCWNDTVKLDGNEITPTEFLEIKNSSNLPKIKNFSSFINVISSDDQKYVDKLRKIYPNRDIPSDNIISNAISKLKNGKEKVVGDLIIRKDDDTLEFELV